MNAMPRASRFTLTEVLVALALTAVVLPVAVHGILIANRAGSVAEKKLTAGRLADRLLAEMVLTESWTGDVHAGEFGTDHPGFRWESQYAAWNDYEPALDLVTVAVFFRHQGNEYAVRLSTLAEEAQVQ